MKTKKLIQEMKENFVRITPKQEQLIFRYWGNNIPQYLTEQDICEQTHKAMQNDTKSLK